MRKIREKRIMPLDKDVEQILAKELGPSALHF
jgi:hypothetical protein